ncbi:phosphotransferase family protein [Demequina zhanjiangensis]|uniref:Phosphotransferase n=1 Tax=Demequina zhanjiangensis TaxID=3051659 RepID=A0ABT8FYX8_9MICO|nr:phosphotransferase [Demequina sp. SYSU T00b26]MDN4472111.1 phosphotransferase [Demequina sp. SYSU T00b26]
MSSPSSSVPEPRNPARLRWEGLPEAVQQRIGDLAGAPVRFADTSTTGFSPGFAGVLRLDDGRHVFAKAMNETDHPHSIWLNRREAKVARALPESTPMAPLLWEDDLDGWHLLGFEAMLGRPLDPRSARDREEAAGLYSKVAAIDGSRVTVAGERLEPFSEALSDLFDRWARLFDSKDCDSRLTHVGEHSGWVARHADELCSWEAAAPALSQGAALVHADLRMDNMVRRADGAVVAVDWPWACVGAPWLDALSASCGLSMQTGIPARQLFHANPVANKATRDAEVALVTTITGYFTQAGTEPDVPSLPGLREFQRGQAKPALAWLRSLVPELT